MIDDHDTAEPPAGDDTPPETPLDGVEVPDLSFGEHDEHGEATDVHATPSTKMEGGCHCGAMRYRVEVTHRHALGCNCSMCMRKGFLHLIVPADQFEELGEDDAYTTYTFGSETAKHYFCKTCGVTPYYVPRSHPDGFSVNVRTLDDVVATGNLDAWDIEPFDGQHWEDNVDSIR